MKEIILHIGIYTANLTVKYMYSNLNDSERTDMQLHANTQNIFTARCSIKQQTNLTYVPQLICTEVKLLSMRLSRS
jgi:hypothetical protein